MNIFIWVLQILLAIWNIIGGVFLFGNYGAAANPWALDALPGPFWIALACIQILLALGLLVPSSKPSLRNVAPISALCLALLSLLGLVFYVTYAGFPGMLWGLVPAIVLAYIAYERFKVVG